MAHVISMIPYIGMRNINELQAIVMRRAQVEMQGILGDMRIKLVPMPSLPSELNKLFLEV